MKFSLNVLKIYAVAFYNFACRHVNIIFAVFFVGAIAVRDFFVHLVKIFFQFAENIIARCNVIAVVPAHIQHCYGYANSYSRFVES
jgi:hypothetical protein